MRFLNFLVFLILCTCGKVCMIPLGLLYEYDSPNVKFLPAENDVSSEEIFLQVPIVFFGTTYKSIYVNSNGFLSFQTDIPQFINVEFPLDYPIIAPFYSNVDTTSAGTISYYETQDPALLHRATENVHENFLDNAEYQATSLFIATWNGVGYYNRQTNKVNTYQVAVITDGRESYVEFLYPENGLQWIQGTGDESGLPDARAQVGFLSIDGKMHLLPGSATEQVRNLEKWSNMNLEGQFIFKVSDKNIVVPDAFQRRSSELFSTTCAEVPTACHSAGTCIDYKEGFCCRCDDTYMGNGKFCIHSGAPLRVNGKLNGKLNGERLDNLDIQSYIVTTDGRSYTAISKIPESIGADIQTLQILGSVIGYLFALPIRGAVNGFQKTGGFVNQTSTITFVDTRQVAVVNQKFLGLDVYDHLKVEIDVQGDIPTLPPDARVDIDEYQEQYTQTSKNVIQMSGERTYTYKTEETSPVTSTVKIDQSFVFESCKFENQTIGESWTLKVGRNFISYESREQIIRFGLGNKILPIGDFDPCEEGRATCGPNSACVVEGNSFECVCNPGYDRIYVGNDPTCVDANECHGNNQCDANSQCVNTVGSYQCTCNPGFEGDGWHCSPVSSCDNVDCLENAECVEVDGIGTCRCIPGFRGDGYHCIALTNQPCNINNNCSPYGICSEDPNTNQYGCSCHPGFTGDGYYCVEINTDLPTEPITSRTFIDTPTTLSTTRVQVDQTCEGELCWCPEGYITEGNVCVPAESSGYQDDCRTLHNCDPNAQCNFDVSLQGYICSCNEGYQGNGYTCEEEQFCSSQETCDPQATCTYIESIGKSRCICNTGYSGNGQSCTVVATCSAHSDCTPTENCEYQNGRYECVCKEGHVRDSQHMCVQLEGSCGGGTCVENAECLFDEDYNTYYCTCKNGFIGDGITECREKPIGCDTLNNCGLHASCKYDPAALTYVCSCNAGFFGNGFQCQAERNCLVDPGMCDRNAQCVTDSSRRYTCQCKPGFVGNGDVCKEVVRSDGNFLLLNQGWATFKIPIDSSPRNPPEGKTIQIQMHQTAVGLDIDCQEGRVYWSDVSLNAIRSARYNGSDKLDFIASSVRTPEGLSIDWVSRNIYWTDSTLKTVEVANLDSKRHRTLFRDYLVNPRGIAVHPERGKIFWTDWDRLHPKIEWANADGSDRKIFLDGPEVSLPNALAIDYDTEQLCFSDAGTKKIECIQIDSKQIQTIAVNCTYPFGITITDKLVYWSDWISKKIERVDKYTLNRLSPITIPAGGSGNKLFGLVAVPNSCPSLTNVCQYSKCADEHICVPNGKGSKTCLCAHKADSNEATTCNL